MEFSGILIINPTLFLFGIIVFIMLISGFVYTILEYRKMDKHPEDYQNGKKKISRETSKKT